MIKANILDLSIDSIEGFLREQSWVDNGQFSQFAKSWYKKVGSDFAEAIIPLDSSLRDYQSTLKGTINTIAQVEGYSVDALIELLDNAYDIVRVRVIAKDVQYGEIPIMGAENLLTGVKNLIVTNVTKVVRRPSKVKFSKKDLIAEYLRGTVFGQTAKGSYIISIKTPRSVKAPVEDKETQSCVGDTLTSSINDNLIKSLESLHEAIHLYIQTKNILVFQHATSSGVDHALCDAVIAMSGYEAKREVEITMREKEKSSWNTKVISFTNKELPSISKAIEYFKDIDYEIDNYLAIGHVLSLSKASPNDEHALITVNIEIKDKLKKISLAIGPEFVDKANRAWKNGWYVKCQGNLHMKKKSGSLSELTLFEVIAPELLDTLDVKIPKLLESRLNSESQKKLLDNNDE